MTGNKKLDTILIIVMFLATSSVAGLFYYTEHVYKKPLVNEQKMKDEMIASSENRSIPTFVKVDKMVISLTPKDGPLNSRMRWLEIEIHLVLFNTADEVTINQNMAIVQDRIIDVTSKMGPEELNSLSGKILLEDRLKKEINQSLGQSVVKNIFFASFIVQ